MKKKIFMPFAFLAVLLISAVTFVSCDTDDLFGTDTKNKLSDYIKIKNVSAHYVGKDVIVDFQVENKSKKDFNDLSLEARQSGIMEDLNLPHNDWWVCISTGEGKTWVSGGYLKSFTIAKGESRNLRIKVTGSLLTTGIKKITIPLHGRSAQMGALDEDVISITTSVTDSRKTANTIWTNDDHMVFGKPILKRDGNDLYATFTITNNTGVNLPNASIGISSLDNGNGTEFSWTSRSLIIGSNTNASYLTINNGETREVTIYVHNFYVQSARCVNATIDMSSAYYEFASEYFHLVSVTGN